VRILRAWAGAALGIAARPFRLAQAAADAGAFADVARAFEVAAQAEGVVGGSLVLLAQGVEAAAHRFGYADADTERLVDADTIYHWASITKTFTAIGLMQLVERKVVQLQDPVVAYLPEFRAVRNPFGSIEEVKVIHLLRHTSGLREGTWPWRADTGKADEEWTPYEPKHWDQLAAMMPYTELLSRPGSKYGYSNPGTTIMGRIIEVAAGDDVEAYLDKNILKPLSMFRTYFDLTPWHLRPSRSNSYAIDKDGARKTRGFEFDTGVTTANGGLNAPFADMTSYANFLAGAGDRALYEEVLSRRTLEAMWRPFFKADYDTTVDERMASSFFTIDCVASDKQTHRFIGHTGSQHGFRAFLYAYPPRRSAAIMAVNTTVEKPRPLVFSTRRRMFAEVLPFAGAPP
jgi:CubicO group peptidase (beta-lactamase class C family)